MGKKNQGMWRRVPEGSTENAEGGLNQNVYGSFRGSKVGHATRFGGTCSIESKLGHRPSSPSEQDLPRPGTSSFRFLFV